MRIAVTGRESVRGSSMVAAVLAAMLGSTVIQASAAADSPSEPALADLSLEDLGNVEVTSVSKRPERLLDAAASIFVISSEDIRRSGYTSLPEVLRLAPNLQVARINSTNYAITARGFNNAVGNKLLVLIDGRTVYTPLFSGVFWDQQDVLLEDVERIEVISGPGATLWGANAVNGVINITTKPASDTQGTFLSLRGGNLEQGGAVRYGTRLSNEGHFRVYAKGDELQNTRQESGNAVADGWEQMQGGFRADWGTGVDRFTVQGDAYKARSEDRGPTFSGIENAVIPLEALEVSGANLLGRWTRQLDDGAEFKLQAYVDHTDRSDRFLFGPKADIFDIEFEHGLPAGSHQVLWGGGYRYGKDDVAPGIATTLIPDSKELNWANLFVQDQFHLAPSLEATLGIKLEHNDYTGLELLPSGRLAWKPSEDRMIWGAVSRAVRAPSRFDREVFLPNFFPFTVLFPGVENLVAGGPDFVSEVAYVYELGYRAQPSSRVTYSVTGFYHDWERLRSGTAIPVLLENKISGHAYGVEAWATFQATPDWRLSAGATSQRKRLRLAPDSTDPVGVSNDTLHNDPEQFWKLRSSHDLPRNVVLDVMVRHMGRLPNPEVPAYTALDLRLGWRASKALELVFAVQNLFDPRHVEFGNAASRSVIERGAYASMVWRL